MKPSPSGETNGSPASQEIPRIVSNPNVHHRINMNPPNAPILSQTYPRHASHPISWR